MRHPGPRLQQRAASDEPPTVAVTPPPPGVRPPPPAPPPQRAKRRLPSAALIPIALVVLLGAGAIAFALTRHKSRVSATVAAKTNRLRTKSRAGTSSTGTSSTGTSSTGTPSTQTSTAATTPTSTSTSTSSAAAPAPAVSTGNPLSAVQSYWNNIATHNFGAAYGDLAPGAARKTEADFATAEEQFGIVSIQFTGHVSSQSGSQSTVTVDSLTTTDTKIGCQTWTGTYTLVQQAGKWLIQQANLTPSPCGD